MNAEDIIQSWHRAEASGEIGLLPSSTQGLLDSAQTEHERELIGVIADLDECVALYHNSMGVLVRAIEEQELLTPCKRLVKAILTDLDDDLIREELGLSESGLRDFYEAVWAELRAAPKEAEPII